LKPDTVSPGKKKKKKSGTVSNIIGVSVKKIQPKHTKTENEISKSMKRIFKGQHFVNINENSL